MSYIIPDARFEMPELFEPGRKPVGNVVSSSKYRIRSAWFNAIDFIGPNSGDNFGATQSGGALLFDGVNDRIEIPDITMNDYTMIVDCIRESSSGNDESVFGSDNYPSSPRNALIIKTHVKIGGGARVEAHIGSGGVYDFTWVVGERHRLIVTRSGTSVKVYVDGLHTGSITVGTGSAALSNIRIGAHYFSGGNNEFYAGRFYAAVLLDEAINDMQASKINKDMYNELFTPA